MILIVRVRHPSAVSVTHRKSGRATHSCQAKIHPNRPDVLVGGIGQISNRLPFEN